MTYNYFVDLSSIFFIIFISGMLLSSFITNTLNWLNSNKVNLKNNVRKLHSLNPLAKKLFTSNRISKALEYKRTKDMFSDFVDSSESAFHSMITLFGISPFVIHYLMNALPNVDFIWIFVGLEIFSIILTTIIEYPINYYNNFKIEKSYGFNTMTRKTFVVDNIKGVILGSTFCLISSIVLYYLLNYVGKFNPINICYFIAGVMLVGFIIEFLYSSVIMYWFNKFSPLPKNRKSLNAKIINLFRKYNYSKVKVLVMDASRRTRHSNAFIGGIGKSKKVVLFDNLLKNYTDNEILAIIGHELGHGKLYHLHIHRLYSLIKLTIMSFITFNLIYNVDLYHAFGYIWVNNDNIINYGLIGFTLSMMVIGSVKWILEPFESWMSRKMEYAADRYSIRNTGRKNDMISSLLKLSSENLSDVFPNEYYEMWNYSHPSIIKRIEAIRKVKSAK